MLAKDFFKCGITGWCLEVLWTGGHSYLQHDFSMMASTSVLMFPIYGLGALIRPVSHFLEGSTVLFRGLVYMIGIFAAEYTAGSLLRMYNICPWNYSSAKYNINGLIRLDYAPAWFTVGLLFEKILNPVKRRRHAH